MSLVSLVLPVGKQYKFTTSKPVTACLNELRVQLKPSPKGINEELDWPLEGRISGDSFAVHRNFDSTLRKLFSPEVQGVVTSAQSETTIRVITAANPSAASIINSSLSTLLGALIGLAITIALVPNMVPRVYAFLWTAVVPFVVSLLSALFSRMVTEGDVKFMLGKMSQCFGSEQVADPTPTPKPNRKEHNMFSQQLMAGCLSCLLCIGIAYFTDSMIVGCWNRGQYDKVESFCLPATQITEAVLGGNNIIAAQCRYQLAEALRAETPAKFKEAEILYDTNLKGKDSYLKGNSLAIANNLFSLGRVHDQTGRHLEADKMYRQAVENWEQSSQVGPSGTLLAKGLDRLAMLCLKEHKYPEAEVFAKKALDIDTKLGDKASRSVGEDLNDMALVYDQQEKYKEAADFYFQAVEFKNKHLDPIDYSRATSLYNLAEIEKILGKEKESAAHATEAYDIWKKILRFKANYSPSTQPEPAPEPTSTVDSPTGLSELPIENPKTVPDPISCYLRIMRATKSDYEPPHVDARFDGLRPYLGRQ
jgi:tetratricopeptide (TPR) repeat protein